MSLFMFLTVLEALIAAALVGSILMQQSEGGGLGVGGSPSGLMSARGAANIMTRITAFLAVAFVVTAIVLAAVSVESSSGASIDTSLDRTIPATTPDPLAPAAAPADGAPASGNPDPLADVAG